MTPLEIFEAKAHYNKWLNQLTESEKDLILEMLKEAQQESIPIEPPVMPKITDFMEFFIRMEKDLIDKVGFIDWQTNKVYTTVEINEIVVKWIDSNFSV